MNLKFKIATAQLYLDTWLCRVIYKLKYIFEYANILE